MKYIHEPTQEESDIQVTKSNEVKPFSYYFMKYVGVDGSGNFVATRKMQDDALEIQRQRALKLCEEFGIEEKSEDLSLKRKKQE